MKDWAENAILLLSTSGLLMSAYWSFCENDVMHCKQPFEIYSCELRVCCQRWKITNCNEYEIYLNFLIELGDDTDW
jgi:hypothetical protein